VRNHQLGSIDYRNKRERVQTPINAKELNLSVESTAQITHVKTWSAILAETLRFIGRKEEGPEG
jgi:hypothetical protein